MRIWLVLFGAVLLQCFQGTQSKSRFVSKPRLDASSGACRNGTDNSLANFDRIFVSKFRNERRLVKRAKHILSDVKQRLKVCYNYLKQSIGAYVFPECKLRKNGSKFNVFPMCRRTCQQIKSSDCYKAYLDSGEEFVKKKLRRLFKCDILPNRRCSTFKGKEVDAVKIKAETCNHIKFDQSNDPPEQKISVSTLNKEPAGTDFKKIFKLILPKDRKILCRQTLPNENVKRFRDFYLMFKKLQNIDQLCNLEIDNLGDFLVKRYCYDMNRNYLLVPLGYVLFYNIDSIYRLQKTHFALVATAKQVSVRAVGYHSYCLSGPTTKYTQPNAAIAAFPDNGTVLEISGNTHFQTNWIEEIQKSHGLVPGTETPQQLRLRRIMSDKLQLADNLILTDPNITNIWSNDKRVTIIQDDDSSLDITIPYRDGTEDEMSCQDVKSEIMFDKDIFAAYYFRLNFTLLEMSKVIFENGDMDAQWIKLLLRCMTMFDTGMMNVVFIDGKLDLNNMALHKKLKLNRLVKRYRLRNGFLFEFIAQAEKSYSEKLFRLFETETFKVIIRSRKHMFLDISIRPVYKTRCQTVSKGQLRDEMQDFTRLMNKCQLNKNQIVAIDDHGRNPFKNCRKLVHRVKELRVKVPSLSHYNYFGDIKMTVIEASDTKISRIFKRVNLDSLVRYLHSEFQKV